MSADANYFRKQYGPWANSRQVLKWKGEGNGSILPRWKGPRWEEKPEGKLQMRANRRWRQMWSSKNSHSGFFTCGVNLALQLVWPAYISAQPQVLHHSKSDAGSIELFPMPGWCVKRRVHLVRSLCVTHMHLYVHPSPSPRGENSQFKRCCGECGKGCTGRGGRKQWAQKKNTEHRFLYFWFFF